MPRVPEYPHHEDRDISYPPRTRAEVCLLELRASLLRLHGQAVAGEREEGREEVGMVLTKAEKRKLQSLNRRAVKLEKDARKLAYDTSRELVRQMKKS